MKIKLYVSSVPYFKGIHKNAVKVLDIDNFIDVCRSVPLFSTVSNSEYYYTSGDLTKEQVEALKKSQSDIYIVDSNIDKRTSLYKLAKKEKLIVREPVTNAAVLRKSYPMLSSKSINTILVKASDFSKLAATKELLNSFVSITDDKVAWLFSADFEDKLFDALGYLMIGNAPRFYELYQDLINLGESKFKFMVLLYNQLKVLLIVKPYVNLSVKGIQNKTGLNYYQVNNNVNSAKKHTISSLKKWFLECGRIERDIKYGEADVDIDLEKLIIDILGNK